FPRSRSPSVNQTLTYAWTCSRSFMPHTTPRSMEITSTKAIPIRRYPRKMGFGHDSSWWPEMSNQDELVDIIDYAGRTVGVMARREMRDRRLPHRCTYVLVFNS